MAARGKQGHTTPAFAESLAVDTTSRRRSRIAPQRRCAAKAPTPTGNRQGRATTVPTCVIEPLNRLTIQADLETPAAAGSFGEVFFGTLKPGNEAVVLKRARTTRLARKLFSKERSVNRKLQTCAAAAAAAASSSSSSSTKKRRIPGSNAWAMTTRTTDDRQKKTVQQQQAESLNETRWPYYLGDYVRDSQSFLVWRKEGDGSTLADYLSTRPAAALSQALHTTHTPGSRLNTSLFHRVTIELLHALRSLHAHGIVHRDIKPSNLLINREGGAGNTIRLIDFGSSCDTGKLLWLNGGGIHTMDPLYAAPETRVNILAPQKFDVFSAGIVGLSVLLPSLASQARLREFRNAVEAFDFDLRKYRADVVARGLVGGAANGELEALFDESDGQARRIFNVLCGMLKKCPSDRSSVESALAALEN